MEVCLVDVNEEEQSIVAEGRLRRAIDIFQIYRS